MLLQTSSAISATDLNLPMILVKNTDPDFYTKLDFSRLFQLLKFANKRHEFVHPGRFSSLHTEGIYRIHHSTCVCYLVFLGPNKLKISSILTCSVSIGVNTTLLENDM